MSVKKLLLPIALGVAIVAGPAVAEDEEEPGSWLPGEFSGSVALTSNYIYRGISQTDNEPAIQGGLNYSLDTGLLGTSVYAGVWGSNVNFNDGDEAQVELDWSFGLSGEIGDTGVGWSLGGLYYNYPGANSSLNYDFWEITPSLTYSPLDYVKLTVGMPYSPDFFGASGDAFYPNGAVAVTIPGIPKNWFKLTANAGLGYQAIDKNDKFGTPSYLTWLLGFTVNIKGVDLGFAYTDTNISKSDCFSSQNLCEPKFVGTLSYAF
ncbi:MAG: TorF family putative porin [Rhodospirillales bacterium]